MAEKVEIIEIDTGQSAKTLKDLKDEIKNLRKELDNCEIGSDKFAGTLEELTQAQTELKNATKSSNEALEGSYDSLVQKMSDLKKAWRATADEAERSDLGTQIASINQQLKDMDEEIGNYQRNVGNYGSAFDDVTIKIEGGVARFEKFNNATRSIVGSFDLVEGGLKAIGVESEEVNGLMNKLQGVMVMTNGLTSIKEGVQAFNAMRVATQAATGAQWSLNAAMAANPIGAIVTIIVAAVAGLTALTLWMNNASDSAETLKKNNEKLKESYDKLSEAIAYKQRIMKAEGKSELEIARTNMNEMKRLRDDYYQEYLKAVEIARNSKRLFGSNISDKEKEELEAMYREYLNLHGDYVKAVQDYNVTVTAHNKALKDQQIKDEKDKADAAKAAAKKSREEWLSYTIAVNKAYQESKKEREEYWMSDLEIQQRRLDEWLEKEIEVINKQFEAALITENEKYNQLAELQRVYDDKQLLMIEAQNQKVKDAYNKRRGEFETLQNSIIMSQLSASEQQLAIIEAQYDKEKQLLDDLLKEKIISQEEYALALDGIADKRTVSERKITEAVKEEEVQYGALGIKVKETGALSLEGQKNIATGVNLVGTAFGQTSQLLTTLANNQDKETERGFENYKKLSIAAAVMSMLQGIITSWTSAMSLPAPISFITGGVMSAFTATMGAIQIDQIKKQKFSKSGGSGGSSANVPTVNTAALLSSPVNYTTEVQGASAVEDAVDTRVYVVESDISDTIRKVEVAEEESTF